MSGWSQRLGSSGLFPALTFPVKNLTDTFNVLAEGWSIQSLEIRQIHLIWKILVLNILPNVAHDLPIQPLTLYCDVDIRTGPVIPFCPGTINNNLLHFAIAAKDGMELFYGAIVQSEIHRYAFMV